jgi:hydroxymethylpyrimidine kinase/phosphomethylpyrimidine kinase
LLGGYGTSVITALTAQNTLGVQGVFPVPVAFVEKQLQSVLSDIDIQAIKTGMLAQSQCVSRVSRVLKKYKIPRLVVDPVMISESGHRLMEEKAVQTLKDDLFPLAGLITPNLSEASDLTGFSVRTRTDMKKAARVIKDWTRGNVLIKGGHLSGAAVDLFFDGAIFLEFSSPRIRTRNTHGTGCTFSAAIATYWGQGFPLIEALGKAKEFITKAIAGAGPIGHGQGPTDPYAWFENITR